MLPGARRRARNSSSNNGIIPGSIWETRMKMDEVKGGIKVFNGDANNESGADEERIGAYRRLRRNQSDSVVSSVAVVEKKKRRNWTPPEPVVGNGVLDKSPVQLRKARSENSRISNGEVDDEEEDEIEIEIEIEGDVKNFDDKEIDLPKVVVEEEKKIKQIINEVPISPEIEKKKDPVIDRKNMEMDLDRDPVKHHPIEVEEEMVEIGSETQNRMQNIVDLVMWREISKSAFVFGSGTFLILSSSYTKDLDFSLLSAISYLGLVYLALIFLYKSILRRGAVEFDEREERCIIGEDEAIWALRFAIPYINEVLIKIKALFSGDPSTTMKLAVLLFVMARCGGSITLWTLAKMVFFGVFTIPKVLSSYSVQLARYGKFWLERFRDGWESCSHKKAVAAAIFTLIWNISSTIARIWAVFMLVVAVKLYQQCSVEWSGEDQQEEEEEIIEQEKQEDSKAAAAAAAAAELSPAGNNNNRNRVPVLHSHHRQRNGPSSSRATAGKERERERETTTKVKKWA